MDGRAAMLQIAQLRPGHLLRVNLDRDGVPIELEAVVGTRGNSLTQSPTAHALLGTKPVSFQRLGISQHCRDSTKGARPLLGDLDQTAPALKVIDTQRRGKSR